MLDMITDCCSFNRNHSSRFEKHKAAFEEGAGTDDAYVDENTPRDGSSTESIRDEKGPEKENA